MEKFRKAFRRLPDPRADNASHELLEVLLIALAATLCGAEGPSDMATFGQSKEGLLRLVLRLEHGIPSHDTFSRIFRLLDPQAFEAAFRRFMAAFAKANGLELSGVVAIDGKALRGAFERGRQSTPLHMVNIWATQARLCLAQRKAPGRNEATGALEVLALLDLEGCTVTADALHCHRAFATTVLDQGAQYVLALKENQSKLFTAAARCRSSCATSCCPNTFPPSACCASFVPTGVSRTSCTGCSTWSSTRIAIDPERTMPPRTLRPSEGSRSISRAPILPKPLCARKSSAQDGTTPSCWACSVICDSPAWRGRGRVRVKLQRACVQKGGGWGA